MDSGHKRRNSFISMLLCLVMVLTMIPTSVFGYTDAGTNDGGGNSGGSYSGTNVWVGEEFMRVSLYWAPIPSNGEPDWKHGAVTQIGVSVDIRSPVFERLNYGLPKSHGDFSQGELGSNNTSRAYNHPTAQVKLKLDNNSTYYQAVMGPLTPGKTEEEFKANGANESGKTLQFPVLYTEKKNGIDPKDYFEHYSVHNELLYILQDRKWPQSEAEYWVNPIDFRDGLLPDGMGGKREGQYVFCIESGVYGNNRKSGSFGFTLREILQMGGSSIINDLGSKAIIPMANSLFVHDNWDMLGLYGIGYSQTVPNFRGDANWASAWNKLGAAVIEFKWQPKGLPVVEYYYDFEDGVIKEADSSVYFQNAKSIKASSATSQYTAQASKILVDDGKAYELKGAAVISKTDLDGYIDQIDDPAHPGGGYKTTVFKDKNDKVVNADNSAGTAMLKTRILGVYKGTVFEDIANKAIITGSNVKNWAVPHAVAVLSKDLSGKTEGKITRADQILKFNDDGSATFNSNGYHKELQLCLLYVKGEMPPIEIEYEDPGEPVIIYRKGNTTVTKMYFDDPTSQVPTKIVTETIPKESTYTVKDEEVYKVKEWVIVDDKTPGQPEDYKDWPTVKENESPAGKSGTTTGDLGPTNWNDPDRELFIKYEKEPEKEPEPLSTDLRLTEKRISHLKSLEHIGGIPTIQFTWADITGSETHSCGSENCGGHSCNERIGADSFLRFVSSNLTSINSVIMGNATGFMPYDINNVYEFNRGNSGGTYDMHPNYGYVIWRGKDIPTIASYKYGDTTGSGKATSAPIIKNLLGENMVGIQPAGARNDKNNSYYMDGFTITEGKSNYDTGNLTAFVNTFGPQDGAAGDKKFEGVLSQFHDISIKYKKAEGDVKVAKDRMDEDESYLSKTHSDHDDGRGSHNYFNKYANCSACKKVQAIYDASVKNYNEKVEIRDGLVEQYNNLATMLGETKTQAGEGTKNLGDYDYSTSWSYCGRESWHNASGGSQTFTPSVRVDVGYGTAGIGDKKVDFKSTNLKVGNDEYQQVQGFPINNTRTIEFYPYVEMLYDTTTGLQDQKINVLGGHKSTLVPQDYVEIGYLPKAANGETSTGLLLQSKQWSTHQAALSLAGGAKNKVLPGGAIYRLTTPGGGSAGNTRTKVAMSSWLTFLPGDTINATIAGKDVYNGTEQNKKNEELYKQVLRSLNSLDVLQIVEGEQVLQEKAGTQKVKNTSGQPTSKDPKYWLKQNEQDGKDATTIDNAILINSVKTNEADLDIITTAENRIYYRIYSKVDGSVYVTKSTTSQADTAEGKGQILGKITKTQGLNELLAQNDEIKALNNRTKLVENYLLSIDRNIGNDETVEGGPTWYNEAFDGICVVRINKVMEVGFKDKDASSAARTAALDPKLQPPRKSQSDLYKAKVKSWFETDKHTNLSTEAGYVGSFNANNTGGGTVKINIQNMNGIYKSKEFWIPNASVMDLY